MFAEARKLILKDRDAARKALKAEIDAQERQQINDELDQIEAEERQRLEREEHERSAANARAAAAAELSDARLHQHELAMKFDEALAAANAAFLELEALCNRVARLERDAGGAGDRVKVVAHARSNALVAAAWKSARPLAKRLGIRRVAGGPHNVKPLTAIYKKGAK